MLCVCRSSGAHVLVDGERAPEPLGALLAERVQPEDGRLDEPVGEVRQRELHAASSGQYPDAFEFYANEGLENLQSAGFTAQHLKALHNQIDPHPQSNRNDPSTKYCMCNAPNVEIAAVEKSVGANRKEWGAAHLEASATACMAATSFLMAK